MTPQQEFNSMRRKCVVTEIGDGRTSSGMVIGYAIFGDNWISSHDKVLYDDNGNEYEVLDFQEIEKEVCKYPELNKFFHIIGIHGYVKEHYSCLKIEGAKIGDVFYTHNFEKEWKTTR